jgi:hypothetical protein
MSLDGKSNPDFSAQLCYSFERLFKQPLLLKYETQAKILLLPMKPVIAFKKRLFV